MYILAAVGTAAGLGNFWRFPILAYEYGGGAFVFALIIANLLIAYPLLLIETVVGQHFQKSAPFAFEKIKRGASAIQWLAILTITGILMYYVPVMAWAIKYLFLSFSGNFLTDPTNYFLTDIITLSPSIDAENANTLNTGLLVSLAAGYALLIYALREGIKSLTPIIKYTATAPFILLFIMIIRGITLPGAHEGLMHLLIPDWSQLANIKLWQAAITQAFFSVSVAFGYFILTASHREKTAEIPKASLLIIAGNFLVSILAGFAVFPIIGFLAQSTGVAFDAAVKGGPMLVFWHSCSHRTNALWASSLCSTTVRYRYLPRN